MAAIAAISDAGITVVARGETAGARTTTATATLAITTITIGIIIVDGRDRARGVAITIPESATGTNTAMTETEAAGIIAVVEWVEAAADADDSEGAGGIFAMMTVIGEGMANGTTEAIEETTCRWRSSLERLPKNTRPIK